MQFLLWIQTASLVIAMPLLASSPSVDIEEGHEDTKTVFVIFSDLKISSEHGFEVQGDFSSIDDSQDSSFGINVRSIGIANTDLEERLWSFQVPSKSSSSVFRVFHRDGADLNEWSRSYVNFISGSFFEYSTSSYADISPSSGWKTSITVSMEEYADYFVSRIDPGATYGANSLSTFLQVEKGLNVLDYSDEAASSISWVDDYVGETTLLDKINLLKEESSGLKAEMSNAATYILSALTVAAAGFMAYCFLKRGKDAKKN